MLTFWLGIFHKRTANIHGIWLITCSVLPAILLANTFVLKKYGNILKDLYDEFPDIPLVVRNQTVVSEVENAVPDSLEHFDLPLLLNFLRIGPSLETNSPCKHHNFNKTICPERRWMVRRHPGFKRLALFGNLMALFLADSLEEAIEELHKEMPRGQVALQSVQQKLRSLQEEHEIQSQRVRGATSRPGPVKQNQLDS